MLRKFLLAAMFVLFTGSSVFASNWTDTLSGSITSTVTLAEVLRKPIELGDITLSKMYYSILTQTQDLEVVEIDTQIAVTASKISAKYKFKFQFL